MLREINAVLLRITKEKVTLQACAAASPSEIRECSIFLNQPLRRQVSRDVEFSNRAILRNGKHLSKDFPPSSRQECNCGARRSGSVSNGLKRRDANTRSLE